MASGAALLLLVALGFFYFWWRGNAPLYVGVAFCAFSGLFAGRLVAVRRSPVVLIQDGKIQVAGWFSGSQDFDLRAPIGVLHIAWKGELHLNQDKGGALISRSVIGKNNFRLVVSVLDESQKKFD